MIPERKTSLLPHSDAPSRPDEATGNPQLAAMAQLLRLETEVRQAPNEQALFQLVANETRGLVRARQVFVLSRSTDRSFRVAVVSSVAIVDRTAPLIQWIERLMHRLGEAGGNAQMTEFQLPTYADTSDGMTSVYPFTHMLYVPLWARQRLGSDGMLLVREIPWLEQDKTIALRLAQSYGHALELLRSAPGHHWRRFPLRQSTALVALAIAIAAAIPVPMTALAPLEIVAREPHVVAMPVDGIVQRVLVEPNATVASGQTIAQLVDTLARNKLELADREVLVAAARLEKASSLSFSDARGRHELGIARAELALRTAERNHARDLLERTSINASRKGIAVFSDRKDLEGKPLAVGERIMLIADPGSVELKIDLAVADSVVLTQGARVKAFLDSDPLHPIEAKVARIDFQARLSETSIATYRMVGEIEWDGRAPPQLGVRGTAQVYGPSAPLALYLLRRPLGALRQWAGL